MVPTYKNCATLELQDPYERSTQSDFERIFTISAEVAVILRGKGLRVSRSFEKSVAKKDCIYAFYRAYLYYA